MKRNQKSILTQQWVWKLGGRNIQNKDRVHLRVYELDNISFPLPIVDYILSNLA